MLEDLFYNPVAGIDPSLVFWQAVIASVLALLLGLIIGFTYKHTHRGTSYSQNFPQVIIVMAIVVSLIMIVIGSNIARAFSLVGALSIIRYRTAVKDARDTMFVFFAMLIGMSCGVGLRAIAVFSTFFICAVIYLMRRFEIGSISNRYAMLKVALPTGQNYEDTIAPYLNKIATDVSTLSLETIRQGTATEVSFRLQLKEGTKEANMIEELKKLNGNDQVYFYPASPAVDES